MGKVAFLFSGQGAQHPGMGKGLYDREPAVRELMDALDHEMPGLLELCFDGSKEDLQKTENTQPCVFALDLACARALVARGIKPDAVAGFSLGEVAALTFAGALSLSEGFALVRHRGELMAQASEQNPGGMRAVVKLDASTIEELAERAGDCWPVNYNSAQQTSVAGLPEGLERLDVLVREAGGRSLPVKVSGAFHSPLMLPATEGLRAWLSEHPLAPTQTTVIANVTAEPYPVEIAEMNELLASQASHPVRWQQTVEMLVSQGLDSFIECGPGKTLTGLVSRTAPDVWAQPAETPEQLDKVLEHLEGSQA